jgi:hypothetical protein
MAFRSSRLTADHPETLAGAFICRDFKSPLPVGVPGDFPWFRPIAEALMKIDDAYEAKHPGLVPGEALDLWMVGVPPSGQFAKKGITSTLFRLCAEVGRNRDFKRCVTECNRYYSQTASRRAGFQGVSVWPIENSASKDERYPPGSNLPTRT